MTSHRQNLAAHTAGFITQIHPIILESCARVPIWQRNKKIVLCSSVHGPWWLYGGRRASWKLPHILLKHSLALDHTWIPWGKEDKVMDEDLNHEAFRVSEHREPGKKAKIPFCTCWSAWWHSWWVLHADLCFFAPWSVRCPPRLFEQTLCRHTTKRRSRHRRRVRISASTATAAHAPASKFTWYPGTQWMRPVLKVLKGWFPRSSCRERSWKLLTSCWSYRHSAFFCFSAASPSWMFCSKAVSLLSLCSWLSWPNSLLVIPFREKTRTVCAHTHTHRQIQQLTHGFIVQNELIITDCVVCLSWKHYPSDQLFFLLLFIGQVLRRQLQLILDQLMLPTHCPYGTHRHKSSMMQLMLDIILTLVWTHTTPYLTASV